VAIAAWAALQMPTGGIRTALILAPVLPGFLNIAIVVWLYSACDEFIRQEILKAAAITAVVTAIWTLCYSFLEIAGLPVLSMMWVSNVGWGVFVLLMLRLMFLR
jgi:hypothetical protein